MKMYEGEVQQANIDSLCAVAWSNKAQTTTKLESWKDIVE